MVFRQHSRTILDKGKSNSITLVKKSASYLMLFLLVFGTQSCKVSKFLEEDQYLVDDVEIKLISPYKDYDKDRILNGMRYFIQQRKNGNAFFIPKEYIYFAYSQSNDTTKFDRVMRNVMGEVPSIYDEEITTESSKKMQDWLRYNKGFYHAIVSHEARKRSYKTDIIYKADLGRRYKYGSIDFVSKDSVIIEEVERLWREGTIKEGSYVDLDRFNSERNRITNSLQNMGYADFASKYIDLKGDSTGGNYNIDLIVEVYPPQNKDRHLKYSVGDITVYTDYYSKQDTIGMSTDTINGVVFFKETSRFLVDPKVISSVILFNEGELVKKTPRLKSFNKLSSLGTYRFTTINPKPSQSDSLKIDYDILLSPHPRKWIADYGADLLYSRLGSSVDQNSTLAGRNIAGVSLNGQLINRNFLRGSERFSITGEIGGQIEIANPVLLRTFNYGLSNYLEFPIFKDHLGQVNMLYNLGFIRNSTYQRLKEQALSTVNLAFNNTDIRDLYRIFIINSSYGYKVSEKLEKTVTINTLGITLNSYELRDSFLAIVTGNPLILNTFQDNLFTGFLFRNLLYSKNGYFQNRKWQWAFYSNFEMSGLEILGLNQLSNAITGSDEVWTIGKGGRFQFAKFGKLELDGRLYKTIKEDHVLAGRINGGMILPFSDTRSAPFIKQYDVGGPNSLRGWGARELGPGATPAIQNNPNILPFQRGDIKLEANLEYRFPIWYLLKGGLFVDVGNIWTLKDDGQAGQFTKDFTDQLAVAAGWGMRWDLDYFIIRFDFGYRIRNPYPSLEQERFGKYWNTFDNILGQGLGNFQVNVNHAF